MASDFSRFKTLTPSQFSEFPIQNIVNFSYLRASHLRVAVLDSPAAANNSPRVAFLIVPEKRETDWMFCTESGHFQLLTLFNLDRLILIGNNLPPNSAPDTYDRPPPISPEVKHRLELKLNLFLIPLHPTECFQNGLPRPRFLTYEDDVVHREIMGRFVGHSVGQFVVENVVLETNQVRRRLRFKTTPNVFQSQIPLNHDVFPPIVTSVLVEPYLNAMVSALFLIASPLYDQMKQGIKPRALCLGVGGSLLTFLHTQLELGVVGVEIDADVLRAARLWFGLQDSTSFKLIVGDAIEWIQKAANDPNVNNLDGLNSMFDVVMVDLVSNEGRSDITAPPHEFCREHVLRAMRSRLLNHGVVVIHVITPSQSFYLRLKQTLQDVFYKVYDINTRSGGSFVLMATVTPIASTYHANPFLERLRSVVSGSYYITEV